MKSGMEKCNKIKWDKILRERLCIIKIEEFRGVLGRKTVNKKKEKIHKNSLLK